MKNIGEKKVIRKGNQANLVPIDIEFRCWTYLMNNSSRYLGSGQRLSSTMSSSLSIW